MAFYVLSGLVRLPLIFATEFLVKAVEYFLWLIADNYVVLFFIQQNIIYVTFIWFVSEVDIKLEIFIFNCFDLLIQNMKYLFQIKYRLPWPPLKVGLCLLLLAYAFCVRRIVQRKIHLRVCFHF